MRHARVLLGLLLVSSLAACSKTDDSATTTGSTAGPTTTASVTTSRPVTTTSGATSTTTARSGVASCNLNDVKDALTASSFDFTNPINYSCVGNWAYADAVPAGQPTAPPQKVLLQANGPRWSVVDTATACAGTTLEHVVRQTVCK